MIFDITLKCASIVAGISQRTITVCAANQESAVAKILEDRRYVEVIHVQYVGDL